MKPKTSVILVQKKVKHALGEGQHYYTYRVAKLIGDVSVLVGKVRYHVGDTITEAQADELSKLDAYEVTVTEKGAQ